MAVSHHDATLTSAPAVHHTPRLISGAVGVAELTAVSEGPELRLSAELATTDGIVQLG